MKKSLLTLIIAAFGAASLSAQDTGLVGDGYYRVRNLATQRYIYVTDNTSDGTLDVLDYSGIQLWKDLSRAISDPASVLFIKNEGGDKYDIQSQGTGIKQILGQVPKISLFTSDGSYEVYGSQAGVTKYLSDNNKSDRAQGQLGDGGTLKYRRWQVDKIGADKSNYFGITPTTTVGGKYYKPFFASFAFDTYSTGMKVYYVSKIDEKNACAVIKEIKGTVPAKTPVLIECSTAAAATNRVDIKTTAGPAPTDNILKGVYFCNDGRPDSKDAYTEFKPAGMRVLDVVNGALCYTSATTGSNLTDLEVYVNRVDVEIKAISANTSYLPVSSKAPANLKVVTEEEYMKIGIDGIKADVAPASVSVYNLNGVEMRTDGTTDNLPAGIYVVGGRKVVVK